MAMTAAERMRAMRARRQDEREMAGAAAGARQVLDAAEAAIPDDSGHLTDPLAKMARQRDVLMERIRWVRQQGVEDGPGNKG